MLEVQSLLSMFVITKRYYGRFHTKTILMLCVPFILSQRVDVSLKSSMPWLVLAGSGGLADFLSDVLENLSSVPGVQSSCEGDGEAVPSVDLKDRMTERLKKYFPLEAETDKLVERVSAMDRGACCCIHRRSRKRNASRNFMHSIFSSC